MAANQANVGENPTIASKRKVVKNTLGRKTNVGWEHRISIFSEGIYRLKHHLAGTQKDVEACTSVTDKVKKQTWDVVSRLQVNLIKKINMGGGSPARTAAEGDTTTEKRKGKELEGNIFKKTRISTQSTINNIFKKNLREE
ncbi:hypothetical protein S83_015629, partial [Arachis hypogaea]